jgi:hypothetical protein
LADTSLWTLRVMTRLSVGVGGIGQPGLSG